MSRWFRRRTSARSCESGGTPLLVPPGASIDETLDVVDGLIFSGGSDVDPELYGAAAHAETGGVVRERDDFELALMRAALARDLPVLAICRGSQVLNVALGGRLEQHVPDRVGTSMHKETAGVFAEHDGRGAAGDAAGHAARRPHRRQVAPPSGLGELGRGLREAARAPDGTIEAVEDPTSASPSACSGIQKRAKTCALFAALVRSGRGQGRATRFLGFLGGAARGATRGQTKFGDSVTPRPQTMTPR